MWQPAAYPDPAVDILAPRFAKYRLPLATGPVRFGDARCLRFGISFWRP
jgi:hypothetical protein